MREQVSYTEFFESIKSYSTKLSIPQIKEMFRLLDGKNTGYFTAARWNAFNSHFLSTFIACDLDKNCLLNSSELEKCFDRPDTYVIKTYFYDNSIPNDIIKSLDFQNYDGINFQQYMLFKRILVGYRQYHINGLLDRNAFTMAFKTTFSDKIIDELDSNLAFQMALYLMSEKVVNNQLMFSQYFEICRLVSNYFMFGITIGEGYVTKSQLLSGGYEIPIRLSVKMFEKYFSFFNDDEMLKVNLDNTKIDPNLLKFEDYCAIDFWGNIFANYVDPNSNALTLNLNGFANVVKNKYFRQKFLTYISFSNFEDAKQFDNKSLVENTDKNTDFDFLTNFSFIQVGSKKSNGKIEKTNSSVFETLKTGKNKASLFDQFKQNENSKNDPKLETALQNYLKIIDLDANNLISFEEFLLFIKYLQAYDRLNKDNKDQRGILSSSTVNCNKMFKLVINQYQIFPRLSLAETTRLQSLDTLLCSNVDFLFFFDYLIGPKVFKPYVLNKAFVDEINLVTNLQKLNLFVSLAQDKTYSFIMGNKVKYDYEGYLKM
jgi:hypothetical protein